MRYDQYISLFRKLQQFVPYYRECEAFKIAVIFVPTLRTTFHNIFKLLPNAGEPTHFRTAELPADNFLKSRLKGTGNVRKKFVISTQN